MSEWLPGILGVIPARWGSTRLPGKMLALIQGKPMVWWVWRRVSSVLKETVVATDHPRVKEALEARGVRVLMTPSTCKSGTDRVALVARRHKYPFYLNVQGDEPLILSETIRAVARLMLLKRRGVFTAASPAKPKNMTNPNIVKVVENGEGRALYFSRAPVPYSWGPNGNYLRHTGIYGYDRSTLLSLTKLSPTALEIRERLEQLRALENGIPIWVAHVKNASTAVDTARDLNQARRQFSTGDN